MGSWTQYPKVYEFLGAHGTHAKGATALSVISNFNVRGRKIGQISKVEVFSWSLMMHNLF